MPKSPGASGIVLTDIQKRQYLSLIRSFSKAKILVLGDFILDQFIWGHVERISPEAPVPVVHVRDESYMLGGSLNVAHNIHTLKAAVYPCGILGRDREGRMVRRIIGQRNIDTEGIVYDSDRPTTLKTRVIANSQQVVRFDRENIEDLPQSALKKILTYVRARIAEVDVIIVEDYGKGVIVPELLKPIIRMARQAKKPILVDPKEKHFPYYVGVTTLTPNRKEAFDGAESLRIDPEPELEKMAPALIEKLKCQSILITLGEQGMILFENGGGKFHIPTAAREVFDVSGAGDTVISVLAVALACKAKMRDAAILSNLAAGIVVGKLGTATVSQDELSEAVMNASERKK